RSTCCRSSAGTDGVFIPSSASVFRAKHRQLPGAGSLIAAHEIGIAVRSSHLEGPVVGREPRVERLGDIDATISKQQRAWRLLAAVACVAFDTNNEEWLFIHPISIRCGARAEADGSGARPARVLARRERSFGRFMDGAMPCSRQGVSLTAVRRNDPEG